VEEQNLDPTSDEGQEQLPPATPPEGEVPKPPEGAGDKGAEKPPETPPPVKTYSVEEWNKRQSSWDTGLEELKRQHKETVKQIQEQLNQRQRAEFVSQAAERGESEEQAGTLFDLRQQLQEKETGLVELAKVLDTAKKDRTADELIEKFTLPKDAKDSLLKAETPTEMKTLALEMALETTKATKTPPVKTPSAVTTGKGIDASKATPRQRAEAYFAEQAGGE